MVSLAPNLVDLLVPEVCSPHFSVIRSRCFASAGSDGIEVLPYAARQITSSAEWYPFRHGSSPRSPAGCC